MKYKNTYIGNELRNLEIKLLYQDFDDHLRSIVATIENEDNSISVVLYEDYRMGNNPFAAIHYFPEDVTFSFEKILMDDDNIQNFWEIKIPRKNLEVVTENIDDEVYGHTYSIILKNGTQITITGKLGWFSVDGVIKTFNISEVDNNIFITQKDVFNKVEISCNTSFQDYKLIYYKKEIERYQQFVEMPQHANRKESNLKRIEELKKTLESIEPGKKNH